MFFFIWLSTSPENPRIWLVTKEMISTLNYEFIILVDLHLDDELEVLHVVGFEFVTVKDKYQRKIH